MARLIDKLTGRGDPVAEIDREIARHARESLETVQSLAKAKSTVADLLAAGADDEEQDQAERAMKLAERRLGAAETKTKTLADQRTTIVVHVRRELERRTFEAALVAGAAHALAARKAAETAATYIMARAAAREARYIRPHDVLPEMPPNVLDMSVSAASNVDPVNLLVERFGFLIQSLQTEAAP